MAPPPNLSYSDSTYLTIIFPHSSPFIHQPTLFSPSPPLPYPLTHISQIGELEDSHIYKVEVDKSTWDDVKEQVLRGLKGNVDVGSVREMEEPKMRVKRGGGEL